jgi:signal peptide peptidase SppA
MKMIAKIQENLINSPWLITQNAYLGVQLTFEQYLDLDGRVDDLEIEESVARDYVEGDIAVVPIQGTLMRGIPEQVAKFFGMTDTSALKDKIEALAEDDQVKGVLLDIDSGGGSASGIAETAEAIAMLNDKKPVYASVEGTMASAAYWLGSQASVVFASGSSKVGSIGVYLPVVDSSESYKAQGIQVELIKNKEATYKGAGFDGTALTDDQKEYLREMVQDIYEDFKNSVLSARKDIPAKAMQGQVYLGRRAKGVQLVDVIGSFKDAYQMLAYQVEKNKY